MVSQCNNLQAAQLTMVNIATAVVIMLTAENFEVASL